MYELDKVVQSKWWSKWEVHGDEGGHEMMVIKLNLEKKKEKNKNREDQYKGIW